jgi:Tfp pilus assembly protein PilX
MDDSTPDLTIGPHAAALRAADAALRDCERQVIEVRRHVQERVTELGRVLLGHVGEASATLQMANYSGAATWLHRAHQVRLMRDELQRVLDLL